MTKSSTALLGTFDFQLGQLRRELRMPSCAKGQTRDRSVSLAHSFTPGYLYLMIFSRPTYRGRFTEWVCAPALFVYS